MTNRDSSKPDRKSTVTFSVHQCSMSLPISPYNVARAPFDEGQEIEIRRLLEAEDYAPAFTPEMREQ